ncbi:FlgD immunoglobulin-like domain containing protein [Spirochaetia bacterium 38H-sp]|uniref:FlgD immunoglobulin-like domain containing protein n=1 Tax=Rarispira pelagica TaxID=3141764 RepID=A0ABU9U8U3_9SPIR
MTLKKGLFIVFIFSVFFVFRISAQSAIPGSSTNYLQVTGSAANGDTDAYQVVFYEVPDTISSTLYFAIEHPGLSGASPDQGTGGTWNFYLIGGSGAFSDSTARQMTYASLSEAQGSGTVLGQISATTETGWLYFPGVLPSQGEHIGNKYYFRIVAEAANNNKNAFRCDVSYINSGTPTGDTNIRAFAYVMSLALLNTNTWNLYPFVPDTASTTDTIDYKNWDMDGGESLAAYDPSGTPLVAPSGSGNNVAAITSYTIGNVSYVNTTWRLQITEGSGTEPPINTSLFWFTINDTTYDATEVPLKIYSASYTPPSPDHVSVAPSSQTVASGDSATVSLQIVDSSGNPVPYQRDIYVAVNGSAQISPDNNATLQTELITTSSDGIASFSVSDASVETVTVTVYWDGSGGSDSFGTSSFDTVSIDFVANPSPIISSAANTSFYSSAASPQALPDINISDSGTADITAANDIRIRIPTGLGAGFDTSVTSPGLTVSGSGAVSPTVSYSGGVLVIDVTSDFAVTDTLTISGLQLTSPFSVSSGSLEMSVDGGTTWTSVDDKIIQILDPNPTYVWDGDTSTSWADGNNWAGGTAPSLNDGTENIIIPNGCSFYPVLSANWSINNLDINTSASMDLSDYNLTVNGTLSNNGTIILSGSGRTNVMDTDSGTVRYSSSSGGVITDYGTTDYYNLEFLPASAASFSMLSSIDVAGALSVETNASLDMGGNNLSVTGGLYISGVIVTGAASLVSADTTVNSGGTLTLSSGGTLTTGILSFAGTVTSSGTINCSDFSMGASGSFTSSAINTVNVSGNISISGTFTDPSAQSTIIMSGNPASITSSASLGNLNISAGASVSQGSALSLIGNLDVLGNLSAVSYDLDVNGNLSVTGILDVSSVNLNLEGDLTNTGVLTLTSSVLILDGAGNQSISMGGAVASSLVIANTGGAGTSVRFLDLLSIDSITVTSAGTLRFDSNVTVTGGNLDVPASVPVVAGGNITLDTSTSNGTIAIAGNLDSVSGVETISLSSGSGAVSLAGVGVTQPPGALSITTTGQITLNNDITVAGNVSFSGPVVLASSVTIDTSSANGNVGFSSTINSSSGAQSLIITAGNGTVGLGSGVGGVQSLSSLSVTTTNAAAFSLPLINVSGTVTLDTSGDITQTAQLTASGLELLGIGNTTLTNVSNNITTLAVNRTGSISYRDTDGVAVGTVGTTSGITSGNNDITITAGGAISINQTVDAGSATVTLDTGGIGNISGTATIGAAAINMQTVSGSGVIGSIGNPLSTSGATTLTVGNASSLTGAYINHTGALTVASASLGVDAPLWIRATGQLDLPAQAIDTGNSDLYLESGSILSTAGSLSSSSGDISLVAATTLGLGHNIASATGIISLTGVTAINQTGGTIAGPSLVTHGGAVSLTQAANDVDTLASDAVGTFVFTDTDGVAIGTVGTTSGITSGNNDISITAGGAISINQTVDAGTGNISLSEGGGISQSASISCSGLEITGSGNVVLTNTSNNVSTLSANIAGSISYRDADGVAIGTVGTTSGITSGNNDITITAGGSISINQVVDAGTGRISLDGAGGATPVVLGANLTGGNGISILDAASLSANVILDSSSGAGDISFSSTIDGAFNLTINGGSGDIVFSDNLGSTTPIGALNITSGNVVSCGGNITTGNSNISISPAIILASSSASISFTSGTGSINITGAIDDNALGAHNLIFLSSVSLILSSIGATTEPAYIMFDVGAGNAINLTASIKAQNIVLYSGTLYPSGNTLESTTGDMVFLGAGYAVDDTNTSPIDSNFAYPGAATLTSIYDPGAPYSGAFDSVSLTGSSVITGRNFYANGINMSATGAWTLNVPDNSSSQLIAYPVPGGAYGTGAGTYAVAYNSTVSNCNAGTGLISASTENGNIDGGGNFGWDFTSPDIGVTVETISDNAIHITFSENIENSNGEITAAVSAGLLRFSDSSGTYAFDEVYSDASLTTPLPNSDTNEFYLVATGAGDKWNTDATGASAGASTSTDRSGTHRTTTPSIYIEKGSLFDTAKNPIKAYGINGNPSVTYPAYTATTDKASPVLYRVEYGRADPASTSGTNYHAHNFFHLYYSEPVTIGSINTTDQNIRTENTAATVGGDIRDDSGTYILVDGYFRLQPASYPSPMERGEKGESVGVTSSNSIYRTLAGLITSPDHELVIFLSGYNDGISWPGWHKNVPNPAGGIISAVFDLGGQITDNSANANSLDTTVIPSLAADSTGGAWIGLWDVDAPTLAPYTTVAGTYEALVLDLDINGRADSIDLHFLDDPSSPWDSSTDHPQASSMGIRDYFTAYPADNVYQAFYIGLSGGSLTNTYNSSLVTGVSNNLFTSVSVADDTYMRLTLSGAPWGVLNVQLDISYDHTQAYLTDLAGNLMEDFGPLRMIERVPPRIEFTLAAAGDNRIYLRFSEPAYGDINHTTQITPSDFTLGGITANISSINIIKAASDNIGAWEAYLMLDDTLTEDEIVSGTVSVVADNTVYDASGNYMLASDIHNVTDIGLGIVEPLWASDSIHTDIAGGGFESLKTFNGSGNLMPGDITLQARILASSIQSSQLYLLYDIDPQDSYYATTDQYNRTTFPDMWFPTLFNGVNTKANTEARSLSPFSSTGALRNFLIPGSDPEMQAGKTLEFIFYISNLYCARLMDTSDLTSLAPWSFNLTDIVRQRSGVTILNNVINPVNNEVTVISYTLAATGMVTIQVFSLDGSLVRTLKREVQGKGTYTVAWDGRNMGGTIVARGLYFIRVVGPDIDEYRKVMIVK